MYDAGSKPSNLASKKILDNNRKELGLRGKESKIIMIRGREILRGEGGVEMVEE